MKYLCAVNWWCLVQVDEKHIRKPTVIFQWMGMNALIIYALAACDLFPAALQGFYWRSPENNLVFLFHLSYFLFVDLFFLFWVWYNSPSNFLWPKFFWRLNMRCYLYTIFWPQVVLKTACEYSLCNLKSVTETHLQTAFFFFGCLQTALNNLNYSGAQKHLEMQHNIYGSNPWYTCWEK